MYLDRYHPSVVMGKALQQENAWGSWSPAPTARNRQMPVLGLLSVHLVWDSSPWDGAHRMQRWHHLTQSRSSLADVPWSSVSMVVLDKHHCYQRCFCECCSHCCFQRLNQDSRGARGLWVSCGELKCQEGIRAL